MTLLQVRNLTIRFGRKVVVDDVSFDLDAGERLGIIGESGSGKTLTSLAVIGLLPEGAVVDGSIVFDNVEILNRSDGQLSSIRGNHIGMVFQEPLTALNPLMRVGKQIAQPLRIHRGMRMKAALARATELCERVGLPDPERIVRSYPHQLSGGQRQRSALMFVSHDLPVVSMMTERVAVMRSGTMVELATVSKLFGGARHEYSQMLVRAARQSDDEFVRISEGGHR
jgi:peptide/nickel transport system ATP-binding protein